MIDDLKQTSQQRMKRCLETLSKSLAKLRSGRAHPSLLDGVTVLYYGQSVPLSQVANVTVEDARTLQIQAWEKDMVPVIDKAILTSELGLNPVTAGQVIRVPLPPLTEERRRDLVKMVKQEGENAKIAIRNIRRDANQQVKNSIKDKLITEDDQRVLEDQVQKVTDQMIAEVDSLLEKKEVELMEV